MRRNREALWLAAAVGTVALGVALRVPRYQIPPPRPMAVGRYPTAVPSAFPEDLAFDYVGQTPAGGPWFQITVGIHVMTLSEPAWHRFQAYVHTAEAKADTQTPDAVTGTSAGFFEATSFDSRVGVNVEYARDFLQFVWDGRNSTDNALIRVDRAQWDELNRRLDVWPVR